ncbi:MAG TPA: hypothetical protein VMZ31_18690 [Phycisphaerae bacterium]|nr:hypothetical protein [Phycisphaerae bacterium]
MIVISQASAGGGPSGSVWAVGAVPLLLLVVLLALLLITHVHWRRRARRAGYRSVRAYLRAAPRTDEEKRYAVELAVRGLGWCLLGILFPPLVLVGVVPFVYGTRKLFLAWLGVGIADELDEIPG